MKRLGNVYEKIYEMDNLIEAHRKAKKDKALYKEVQMVNSNPEYFLWKIQKLLKEKKYYISPEDYTVQTIRDKTKSRELWKLKYYPHRIIQRAIMLQMESTFDSLFCDFVCASVRKKWWNQVMKLMDRYMRDKEWSKYCLKIDIQKFYPSVNHRILKRLLRRKFKDPDLLNLLDMIIDSFPWRRWLPIGSYLSQYLANYYLAYFDHWLKEELKCKYVIRYMDDVVILEWSKKRLRYILKRITAYLWGRLNLKVKWNYQIFPVPVRWVDFVWYRYFYWYRLLRKRTCKKFKKKARDLKIKQNRRIPRKFKERCAINSYSWWLIYCDSWRLYEKYIDPILPSIIKYYKENISEKNAKRFERKVRKLKWKKTWKHLSHKTNTGWERKKSTTTTIDAHVANSEPQTPWM